METETDHNRPILSYFLRVLEFVDGVVVPNSELKCCFTQGFARMVFQIINIGF